MNGFIYICSLPYIHVKEVGIIFRGHVMRILRRNSSDQVHNKIIWLGPSILISLMSALINKMMRKAGVVLIFDCKHVVCSYILFNLSFHYRLIIPIWGSLKDFGHIKDIRYKKCLEFKVEFYLLINEESFLLTRDVGK